MGRRTVRHIFLQLIKPVIVYSSQGVITRRASEAEARDLVSLGNASWLRGKGQAIQMRYLERASDRSDVGLSKHVMLAAADGEFWARNKREAYGALARSFLQSLLADA